MKRNIKPEKKNRTTSKSSRIQRMRRRRMLHTVWLTVLLLLLVAGIVSCFYLLREKGITGIQRPFDLAEEFPANGTSAGNQTAAFFAEDLCVGENNISLEGVTLNEGQNGALFNLDTKEILYAQNIYDKLYPASMTKIMTGLLALEYGNMDDIVTISQSAVTLEAGSQVCGFQAGDQVSMTGLVNCLLVYSGNDAASAIAEHIGGSQDAFVTMMNQKAYELGMTGTHFTNPHGLQDEEHYTTAYDIYLMLREAMNNQKFLDIIQQGSYTVNYQDSYGNDKATTLLATDHYLTGEATPPRDVTILGGKTGTTSNAGNYLALLSQNAYGTPYISIVTNSSTKEQLYEQMNLLLSHLNPEG